MWANALQDFREALKIDSEDVYSLSREAEILFRIGEVDKAWKSLNYALDLEPGYPFAVQVGETHCYAIR